MHDRKRPRLLFITQVYFPDLTAHNQHFVDLAEELARREWDVHVLTSARAYDHPGMRFPKREWRYGGNVRRLPLSSFGKQSIMVRLLGQTLFMVQAIVHGLLLRRLSTVVVSPSPPFAGFGGAIISIMRRVPFVWWVMDLNPDQMVAAGKLAPT